VKTCNEIQAALRDRFDIGEDVAGYQDEHFATCEACQSYRTDLVELATGLGQFEVLPPREDLSASVIQHVREQSRVQSLRAADYFGIAVVAGGAAAAAGWFMPVSFAAESWWSLASNWLGRTSATYTTTSLFERFGAFQDSLNNAFASAPSVSEPLLWSSLAVCCIGAVAFNAFMAKRLRTAGD
jgi:hypothetical protein